MTMTILTHPLQALLVAMVLARLVRLGLSSATDYVISVPTVDNRHAA
jgi:hypothetical protein